MDLGTTLSERLKQTFTKSDAIKRFVRNRQKLAKRQYATLRDLKITNESGELVPLILNPVQRELMQKFGLDPDDPFPKIAGRLLRKRILKARREGMSTIILALMFLDTYNNEHRRTIIVAHEGPSTESIFEMVGRFYDNLPTHKKIPKKRSNRKELYWQMTDSRFYCATAGTDNVGSGSTLHNVLKSERAKWKGEPRDIAALDASLDEACRLGNIIEETTANGINFFFRDWNESKAGRGIYSPIFFAWFDNPLYRALVQPVFKRTEEEQRNVEAYGVDDEQLQWYRNKAEERGELMKQEYPYSDTEAFISTGTHYFDQDWLHARLMELQNPEYDPIKNLVFSSENACELRRVYGSGELQLWDVPQQNHYYIVTADPSMGLTDRGDTDYCSADVLDADTWEQVGHLYGKWEPHDFAKILNELGHWYNLALMVILNQGRPGGATTENMLNVVNEGHGYPKQRGRGHSGLFYFAPWEITGKASRDDPKRLEAGFPENVMTKPWMMGKLVKAIEDVPGITINSKKTIEQMMTYIQAPGGSSEAEKGAHDDSVSSISVGAGILTLRYDRNTDRTALTPREPSAHYGSGNRR